MCLSEGRVGVQAGGEGRGSSRSLSQVALMLPSLTWLLHDESGCNIIMSLSDSCLSSVASLKM